MCGVHKVKEIIRTILLTLSINPDSEPQRCSLNTIVQAKYHSKVNSDLPATLAKLSYASICCTCVYGEDSRQESKSDAKKLVHVTLHFGC